jgi:outer membrane protein
MQKKLFITALTVIIALTMGLVFTPRQASAEGVIKIGVFNLQKAINDSKKGQAAKARLVSKYDRLKKQLEAQEKEIEKLQKDLDRQRSMLSEEAQYQKSKELRRKQRDFQDQYRDATQEMQKEEMEATKPIVEELLKIAQDFGKERGYSIIMETQKAGIIYAPDALDITEDVVKRLDR